MASLVHSKVRTSALTCLTLLSLTAGDAWASLNSSESGEGPEGHEENAPPQGRRVAQPIPGQQILGREQSASPAPVAKPILMVRNNLRDDQDRPNIGPHPDFFQAITADGSAGGKLMGFRYYSSDDNGNVIEKRFTLQELQKPTGVVLKHQVFKTVLKDFHRDLVKIRSGIVDNSSRKADPAIQKDTQTIDPEHGGFVSLSLLSNGKWNKFMHETFEVRKNEANEWQIYFNRQPATHLWIEGRQDQGAELVKIPTADELERYFKPFEEPAQPDPARSEPAR